MESESEQKRRRRNSNYPLEFKRQLAQQACDDSVSVAQLAMQHGLNTNMLFRWWRQLRAGLFDTTARLLPVILAPTQEPTHSNDGSDAGVIEIQLRDATVRILGSADPATLTLVLKGLRA